MTVETTVKAGGARWSASVEWPTLAVAAAIYGGFALLTWFHAALPWWLLLALGGPLVAWHGSLQHEVVHGHPTPWRGVNRLLVLPSLWLWLPFEIYRDSHLLHHRDENLTEPAADPESYYLAPADWARAPAALRAFLWMHNSLAGRLLLGPAWCVLRFFAKSVRRAAQGETDWRIWAAHGLGVALVLGWVVAVAGLPLWQYLLLFAYPGLSLTLLRSFLEHQARGPVGERTVIVEAGPLWSLLFLNNNLHLVHHRWPGAPWYRLPALWRRERVRLLADNAGYRYSGYAEVICRFLLWPKEHPAHPGPAGGAAGGPAIPLPRAPALAAPLAPAEG